MIRQATTADLKAVYDIIEETSHYSLDFQVFAQTFVDQLGSLDRKMGVYEEDGEIMGFVGILCTWQLYIGYRVAETKELAVSPKYRDRGIRDELLAWAENVARESGCGILSMCSRIEHTDSHEYYKSQGFHESFYRFDKEIALKKR
ncbi:hypothetical protein B9G54_02560 [Alloscardovia macacae]|uniref:N-acetyltransferase domain-containing protein n=1 Tax=Alloscardovia macacae TaxID=1160091 RepID=A0A1Y2SXE8_9BIFI|nr:GNAT family N-acetyltransferase [Alloscardovia macacae]OTA26931.1 hypothetical protein B9G54_02560 [Alloscardovia macacae]OTA30080.1 hypothetical protein B9T39_01590 [Alloscardovia macacae]